MNEVTPRKFTRAWFRWIGAKGGSKNSEAQKAARALQKAGAGRPRTKTTKEATV